MNKDYLWNKLDLVVRAAIENKNLTEVILNPDGRLWGKHIKKCFVPLGDINDADANSFVHALAQYQGMYLNQAFPYLETTLPFNGERISITVPPISDSVSYNIRKKATTIYTLTDYIKSGCMTQKTVTILKRLIIDRKNILISGGPGTGKTTLVNALLDEMRLFTASDHRVLLLEQTPELQCSLPNTKRMLTTTRVDLNRLLYLAMRQSPDCIIVGEVRDGSALAMLKAWNTGCRGGIATIHANSATAAMQRVIDLSMEACQQPPKRLAAEAIDVVLQLESSASNQFERRLTEALYLKRYSASEDNFDWVTVEEYYDQ